MHPEAAAPSASDELPGVQVPLQGPQALDDAYSHLVWRDRPANHATHGMIAWLALFGPPITPQKRGVYIYIYIYIINPLLMGSIYAINCLYRDILLMGSIYAIKSTFLRGNPISVKNKSLRAPV